MMQSKDAKSQSIELVVIDHPNVNAADELASILEEAGFHPRFDDLPRPALRGRSITTPMLVPKEEAAEAKRFLAEFYAIEERRISEQMRGWWRPCVLPATISLGLATFAWLLTGDFFIGLAALLVGFIVILQAMASSREKSE